MAHILADNIIMKIKTNFFNSFIPDLIEKNSINKNIRLKKLRTREFIANLTKPNNIRLFQMKLSEILIQF